MLINHKTHDMERSREQSEKEMGEKERKKETKSPTAGMTPANSNTILYHVNFLRYKESNKAVETGHLLILTTAIGNTKDNRYTTVFVAQVTSSLLAHRRFYENQSQINGSMAAKPRP